MGPGAIIQGAEATAGALRSWGGLVADAARGLPAASRAFRPLPLSSALQLLKPVDESLVHTVGWEMRNAVSWVNDGRCLQRALATALSAAQHERGSVPGALDALTTADARSAVLAVAYHPKSPALGMWDGFHGVALFRTKTDQLLAIDHTFASAPDGVIAYDDLLRTIGARAEDVRLMPATFHPPDGLGSVGGVPSFAKALGPEDLHQRFDDLAEQVSPTPRTRDRYGALIRS